LERLAFLDEVAAAGGEVVGQAHVRQQANVSGFRLSLPYDRLEYWQTFRQRPLDDQLRALRDPDERRRLVDDALNAEYQSGTVVAEVSSRAPDYENIQAISSAVSGNRSVAEIARERNCSPVDVIIDLSVEREFDQFFLHTFGNSDPAHVLDMMRHRRTVLAASDAGAHVSQIIESSLPTFLLAYWVREQQAFSLEEGVRQLTSDPAARWGLAGRGQIAEGFAADLVIFDPETVAPVLPHVAYDLPSGGKRLVQSAVGVHSTIVNGEVVFSEGSFSEARPGRLLRGPLANQHAASATRA
jgi:N-acyl-D-aspartate/D-glutamate deacylase